MLDTNVLVSAILFKNSAIGILVRRLLLEATILISADTADELKTVLSRSKFDPYLSADRRSAALRSLLDAVEWVSTETVITDCRDPRDDKLLQLALDGCADLIISGDKDLLALHPWRGIAILAPASLPRP